MVRTHVTRPRRGIPLLAAEAAVTAVGIFAAVAVGLGPFLLLLAVVVAPTAVAVWTHRALRRQSVRHADDDGMRPSRRR